MNIGQFRSFLKDMPDDGLVSFYRREEARSVPVRELFPAIGVCSHVNQIEFYDGRQSSNLVVELFPMIAIQTLTHAFDDDGCCLTKILEILTPFVLHYLNQFGWHYYESEPQFRFCHPPTVVWE